MNLLSAFKPITAFVFDVDGVMTDGSLLISPNGEWLRRMHIRDGYALQLAIKKGYRVAIISGAQSDPVAERLKGLGLTDIFQGEGDKATQLEKWMKSHGLLPGQVLFMGDDIPDLGAMRVAGLPCCPLDAALEIKSAAQYISPYGGGQGCVRDVIEKVLKLNGHWPLESAVKSL